MKINFESLLRNVVIVVLILASLKILLPKILNKNGSVGYTIDQYIHQPGYVVESHYVTTFDGYILNLQRIHRGQLNKTNDKVVVFVHGMFGNYLMWMVSGDKKSIPLILADQGYDVWLYNNRGTKYSRNHTILNSNSDGRFWNFSWHEMGIYDLPSMIDYILQQTSQNNLSYIGHSEGCTLMYVLLSTIPSYNKKIKAYINLGPAAFIGNAKSIFSPIPSRMLTLMDGDTTRGSEMFTSDTIMYQLFSSICSNDFSMWLCILGYYKIFGYSPDELNSVLLPLIVEHVFTGGSNKEFKHYVQVRNSGQFRQFDYGVNENVIRYGRSSPPNYGLSRVTAPGYLIYGDADPIADATFDIPRLYNALGNCLGKFLVPKPAFNHVDFVFGKSADIVYTKILELLSQN